MTTPRYRCPRGHRFDVPSRPVCCPACGYLPGDDGPAPITDTRTTGGHA